MDSAEDSIEDVVYRYVYVSGEVTFRRLLSFLAQHSSHNLRRDRVALVLGSMASDGKIKVKKVGAEWRISPKQKRPVRQF
ncbi:MAG: hypothetical protein QW514_05980 [Thermoprotei archaeon]